MRIEFKIIGSVPNPSRTLWGSRRVNQVSCVSLQHNCTKVKTFLRHRLGRYITNVTRAAEFCSDFLCRGNGRCVRRDPLARHYLHLSSASFHIHPLPDGGFAVSGWPSPAELRLLSERFRCHCYEGYGGERCDSINEVREDDGPWVEREEEREQEEEQEMEEQERRRTEWEAEQAERWQHVGGGAPVVRGSLGLLLAVLLLSLTST